MERLRELAASSPPPPPELDSYLAKVRTCAYAITDDEVALRDAIAICLFSMIVRLADSFGWEVPPEERLRARAPAMLAGGYTLEAARSR